MSYDLPVIAFIYTFLQLSYHVTPNKSTLDYSKKKWYVPSEKNGFVMRNKSGKLIHIWLLFITSSLTLLRWK